MYLPTHNRSPGIITWVLTGIQPELWYHHLSTYRHTTGARVSSPEYLPAHNGSTGIITWVLTGTQREPWYHHLNTYRHTTGALASWPAHSRSPGIMTWVLTGTQPEPWHHHPPARPHRYRQQLGLHYSEGYAHSTKWQINLRYYIRLRFSLKLTDIPGNRLLQRVWFHCALPSVHPILHPISSVIYYTVYIYIACLAYIRFGSLYHQWCIALFISMSVTQRTSVFLPYFISDILHCLHLYSFPA